MKYGLAFGTPATSELYFKRNRWAIALSTDVSVGARPLRRFFRIASGRLLHAIGSPGRSLAILDSVDPALLARPQWFQVHQAKRAGRLAFLIYAAPNLKLVRGEDGVAKLIFEPSLEGLDIVLADEVPHLSLENLHPRSTIRPFCARRTIPLPARDFPMPDDPKTLSL